jgi:hypothetical protein
MVKLKLGVRSAGDLVADVLPGSDNPTGDKIAGATPSVLYPLKFVADFGGDRWL